MKVYTHKSCYGPVKIPCYDTNDMAADEYKLWSWNRSFGTWDKYFDGYVPVLRKKYPSKTRKWLIAYLIRNILKEFFTLVIEDLILHNDSYQLPNKLGRIQISYNHPNARNYKYDLETQGKTYKPVFIFTKHAFRKVKVQYYISFTRQWREMLKAEINKGHTYELVRYEHRRITSGK